jgi:hypothetical protein
MAFTVNVSFDNLTQANRPLFISDIPRRGFQLLYKIGAGSIPFTWNQWGNLFVNDPAGLSQGAYLVWRLYFQFQMQVTDEHFGLFKATDDNIYDQLFVVTVPWLPDGEIEMTSFGDPPP